MSKRLLLTAGAAFFLLGLFTCTWDLLLIWNIGGITLKVQQGFFLLAFLCVAVARWKDGVRVLLRPLSHGFPGAILLLGFYYLLGSPWSAYPLKSFLYSCWLLFNFCTVWWSLQLLAPQLGKKLLWAAVLVTMTFHSIVVLVDYIAYQYGYIGGLIGFNQDALLHWGVSRPHAFANEPSYLAAFLALGLLFCVPLLLRQTLRPRTKLFLLPAFLLCCFALVATTSRTGVIALVPGMALVLILDFRRRKSVPWRLLLGLAGLVLVCFAVVAVSTPTKQRARLDRLFISSLLHGQDGSTHARLLALKEAGQIARESHGLGVGLGASYRYWEKTRPHDPNLAPENGQMGHELIMSIWGQLLAEGGIPALLLYAAAAIFLLRTLLAQWRREHDSFSLGSLVAALVFFGFIAFAMGNVARGDVWVWFALWSRMALPDSASLEKA